NYRLTPFVSVEKISDNLTIRTGFSSKSGEAIVKTKSIFGDEFKVKEDDIKALGNTSSNTKITWAYDKNFDSSWTSWFYNHNGDKGVYFVKLKNYFNHKETNEIDKLLDKKYRIYLNLDYDNEVGFNVRTNLDLEYNNIKYTSERHEKNTEITVEKVYAIKSDKQNQPYTELKEQFKDENVVFFVNGEAKKAKIKKIIEARGGKMDRFSENPVITAVDQSKKVNKEEVTIKNVKENLQYRSLNVNSDIHLGYNFKVIDKFFMGVGVNHKLDLKYVMVDNILLDDLKLFGSNMLKAKNVLSPEVSAKYNIIKGISWTSSINVPVSFENAKYKRTDVNIKTGFEFKW
ncbi:hypothetical protein, partial [Caviibacter abscessus]|uniref:hypothetical protein n=1 Tax=Caviibacter abscessus TaxID=1766719 RepID=UPI0018D21C2E